MNSSKDDPDSFDRSTPSDLDLLAWIAATLDLPPEAFFRSDIVANARLQVLDDTAELIGHFSRIDDRKVRRRCIDFVKAASDGNDSAPSAAGIPV